MHRTPPGHLMAREASEGNWGLGWVLRSDIGDKQTGASGKSGSTEEGKGAQVENGRRLGAGT